MLDDGSKGKRSLLSKILIAGSWKLFKWMIKTSGEIPFENGCVLRKIDCT